MRLKLLVILFLLPIISPLLVVAGNFGGGSTGAVDDEEVFFVNTDDDIVNYEFRYFTYGTWYKYKMSLPIKGIDPKYLIALRNSAHVRAWVKVNPKVNDCAQALVKQVNFIENRNILQCAYPPVEAH